MPQPSAPLMASTESVGRLLIKKPKTPGRNSKNRRRLDLALEAAFMISFEWDIVNNRVTRFGSANPSLPTEGGPLTVEGVRDIVHPDDRDVFMANLQSAIDDPEGHYRSEFRYVLPDGRIIWTSEYGHVEHDPEGRAVRLIGLSQDITASRRTWELMQAERDRLEALVNSIHDEVWLANAEGKFTLANPSARHGFNLQSANTDIGIRDLATSLEVFRPDGSPRPVEEAPPLRALRGEALTHEEEIIRMPVSGELRYRQLSSSPIRNQGGEIVGSVTVVRDITKGKQIEQELRAAKEEAERANNAKSRFLAAASHDLRQPLSALTLYTGALKGHVTPSGAPLFANMVECIASLSELLEDLLDLSKLEAGVVVPNVRSFAVTEVLEPLLSAHVPGAKLKGLRVRYRPTSWVTRTDPVLLQRLLGNFISNAIRYTAEGGILIACRRHDGRRWLEVWDTGLGFPADKTDEIFEEFKQLGDGARTRGSGLGLAIVARTASLLGLAIRVRSRPGRGSMFAVELPPGDAHHESAQSPASHAVSYRTLRIALVEDNSLVRNALTLSLQGAGHRVIATETGAALLERLQEVPDILVSDYRLAHGETGFNVIAAVRRQFPHLPAILLTGDTDPRLVREMADRGVIVLHKPVDLETLLAYFEDLTSSAAT